MPDQDIAEAGGDFPVSPPAGMGIVPKKSPCSRSNSAFKFINGKRYVFASAINPGSTDESKKEPDISALQILLQPACHLRRLPHIEPNPPAAVETTMNTRAIHQVVNFPRALFSIFIIAV